MNKLKFLNKELGTNHVSLNDVNFNDISYQKLSEDFIREFKDKLNWYRISRYQKLSEDFIREFKNKVNWCEISACQKLSPKFITEFKNEVDWAEISTYQKLSENFIFRFRNYVDWDCISQYQILSEDFIKLFFNKFDKFLISTYQKLSLEFREQFDINIDCDNWLYRTTEFKKQQVIDCGLYECHEDYFIACKSIRNDRYSHFNFQYQYLAGEIYEAHCDCSCDENSFGLSVWTEEGARRYCDSGLIVRVKVHYEDVGRLVHDSNKVRCFKIEILN